MGPGNLLKPRHINPLDTDVNRITTIFLLTLKNAKSRANIVRIHFYLLSGAVRMKEDVKVWAEDEKTLFLCSRLCSQLGCRWAGQMSS